MNKTEKNSLLEKLNSDEFNVTQNKGTEAPFTGKYLNNKNFYKKAKYRHYPNPIIKLKYFQETFIFYILHLDII